MAPYNNSAYGTHYDPVGSQYNQQQQQQGYTHPGQNQRSTATPHYLESSTSASTYQPSYQTAYANSGNSYYNSWSNQTPQPAPDSTEDRAAETLSHLSAQDQTTAASRAASGQYGRYDSTYTPSMTTQPTSAATRQKDTNNSSPVYQISQPARQAGSASSHSSAQSYATATATPTYQYVSVYGNSTRNASSATPNASTRPSQSSASTYQQPVTASRPHPAVTSFRPDSTYTAQQQQSKMGQSRTHKDKASIAHSSAAGTAQSNAHDQRPANVGQPRAPSVTPSAIQQQQNYGQPRRESMHDTSAPTTVDPNQIFDRWPEQEKRIREAERRRAEEDAAKAKKEEIEKRVAEREETIKLAERAKKAEETRKAEEARTERTRRDQEAKKAEDERKAVQDANAEADHAQSLSAFTAAMGGAPPAGSDLEAEMVAMFKKMREFNEKNPTMLARLWDQERRAHIGKAHATAAPPAQPTTSKVATAAPVRTPSTASVQSPQPTIVRPPSATVGAVSAYAAPARQNVVPPSSSSSKPAQSSSGPAAAGQQQSNAIWPPGKKSHLAEAAAKWLNARSENAGKHVTTDVVVTLLDSNPSYLLLCESLESMDLFVDRAAFARALLSAVPDVNKHQGTPQVNSAQPLVNADAGVAFAPASAATQASVHSISPAATSASDITKRKNKDNIGRFGSVRGRPKKDAVPTETVKRRIRDYKGNLKQMQTSSGGIVDLTGPMASTRTDEFSAGPSLAVMYQNALASDSPSGDGNTVAYQSGLDFTQPPSADDDNNYNDDYQALPALPKSASGSIHLPSGPKPSSYSLTHYATAIMRPDGQRYRPKQSQPPSRPPANKEEAARKRNFADLVDLTAADDSEEEDLEPPSKYPNFGHVAAGAGVPPPSGPGFISKTQSFDRYMYVGNLEASKISHRTSTFGQAPQAPMQATTQASMAEAMQIDIPPTVINLEAELKGKKLVDGIKREKVARKSRYDSRTICRDVLLATGRHPDMRALNEHLFEMHEFLRPHAVDAEGDKFDLATIRWDLIDPGEPIPDATTEDKASGASTDDGEVAEAEEEPGQALERQLLSDHDREINNTGYIKHRKPFPKKNGRGRPRKSMPNLSTARATGETGGETSDQADGQHPASHERSSTALSASRPPATSTFTPVNKPTRQANMSGTPSSAPVGYAAFKQQNTQLDEFGNPIKRKGRPVGWRKSVHSKAAVAAAGGEVTSPPVVQKPSPSHSGVKRRPGRPPTKQIAQSASVEPEAKFNVFKCEWEGCAAELHNLDTLRKHVIKLHGKKTEENDYECLWKDCLDQGEDASFVFAEMTGWLEHIEKTHLKPMARLLGDGPRLGLSVLHDSKASEAYLSDATGRIITPKIEPSPLAKENTPEWRRQRERQLAAKRISGLKGIALEREELLQQLEQEKRMVGPGLGPAGCIFITDSRRRGFYDDEDFDEVVECDKLDYDSEREIDSPLWG